MSASPALSGMFHILICHSIAGVREVKALSNASALDSIKFVPSSGPDCPQQYNAQVYTL